MRGLKRKTVIKPEENIIMHFFSKIVFAIKKRLWIVALLALLVSICPLVYIGQYNYSSADDYLYGIDAHLVWENTHSIIDTVIQAAKTTIDTYTGWQGTYSAVFFMSLHPGVFGETFYHLGPMIVIALLCLGNIILFSSMVKKITNYRNPNIYVICFILIFLQINLLPNPIQGFYWWNSAFYYTDGFAIMLIYFSCLIEIAYCKKKRLVGLVIASILLALFLGGINFIAILLTGEIGFLLILSLIKNKNRSVWYIIPSYVIFLIGAFINISAPGNTVRFEVDSTEVSFFQAIKDSFVCANQEMVNSINIWIIAGMIVVAPLMKRMIDDTKIHIKSIFLYILVSYCIYASSFTPTVYVFNSTGPYRTWNPRCYLLIMLLFACEYFVIYFITSYRSKNSKKISIHLDNRIYTIVCILFLGLALLTDKSSLSSYKAIKTVLSGEGEQYGQEMNYRINTIKTSKLQELYFNDLTVKPELLYYPDIEYINASGFNYYIAKWYGKEYVCFPEYEYNK